MLASISLKSGATDPGRIVWAEGVLILLVWELGEISRLRNAGLVAYRIAPSIRPNPAPASNSFLWVSDGNNLDMLWGNGSYFGVRHPLSVAQRLTIVLSIVCCKSNRTGNCANLMVSRLRVPVNRSVPIITSNIPLAV